MNEIEEARKKLKELDRKVGMLRKEVKNSELTKFQAAIKKRESEVKVLEAKLEEPLVTEHKIKTKKQKTVKKHITLPKITITPRARKVVASAIVICMVTMMLTVFVTRVRAVDPDINFADPDNGGTFADTNDGDGVNWIVNVTDADSDLAWVRLYSNDSGSWVMFYNSGALGGVAYHNASGQNGNWTGSWTIYWYNISADDGTTHDTTYSFTTAYQWGDPQMAMYGDDAVSYTSGMPYKNNTGEYYLALYDATDKAVKVKKSDTGTNWSLMSHSTIDDTVQTVDLGVYDFFTYNNEPAFFYVDIGSPGYITIAHTSDGGSSWSTTSTGVVGRDSKRSRGSTIEYYNGYWQFVAGRATISAAYLAHYRGVPWNTWTKLSDIEMEPDTHRFYPSLAVLDGVLHLIYKDTGNDLHWRTYDGVSWTDKGDIEANIGEGCSMVKDPVNDQVVVAYINNSGDLVYRITDNLTSWSDNHTILSKGSYTLQYPHVGFMDSRLVTTFGYNLRGNYNIYTISVPDYSGRISGLNYTLNRIQFPDANPDDTNVNSTVFSLKNIDNRSIFTIMWHFEDIGEIANASNFKVWTNMSGAWTSIGTTDAGGDVATLDISGLMAGGGEWIPGQTTWWKVEILDVGSVSEDIHTTDEDIYYKITFA